MLAGCGLTALVVVQVDACLPHVVQAWLSLLWPCDWRMELAGESYARPLRALSRVVLAAMVWLPQQLSMSSRAAAVTETYCLRDPMDRTE